MRSDETTYSVLIWLQIQSTALPCFLLVPIAPINQGQSVRSSLHLSNVILSTGKELYSNGQADQ